MLTFALLCGQNHCQVLHPHYLPFIVLIILMTVTGAITFDSGLWYVIRDRQPMIALAWMVLAVIPLAFFGLVGLYAMIEWGDRWLPNNLPMNLAKVMGVTLMRLEASIEYPNRLETERLVMFYDRLEHPREDADAMDRDLAAMETTLGGSLRGKVFWIRGSLPKHGLNGLSTMGLPWERPSPTDFRVTWVWIGTSWLMPPSISSGPQEPILPMSCMKVGRKSQCGETPAALSRDALMLRSRTPRSGCVNFWGHPGITVILGQFMIMEERSSIS